MINSTLCYIRRGDEYLMLHRIKKENDLNHDKWIGIGGKFEDKESPEDCVLREAWEETGLTIRNPKLIGSKSWMQKDGSRYLVLLYIATEYEGELHSSEEGDIAWMTIEEMRAGKMVEGMELYFRVYLDRDVSEIWYVPDGENWIEMLK